MRCRKEKLGKQITKKTNVRDISGRIKRRDTLASI